MMSISPEPFSITARMMTMKCFTGFSSAIHCAQSGIDLTGVMFSMADIHRIIGPNAARYVGMADQIGTLEPGKLADILLIDGNPTLNIYEMLKTKVVLKEGKVVVDKRTTPSTR